MAAPAWLHSELKGVYEQKFQKKAIAAPFSGAGGTVPAIVHEIARQGYQLGYTRGHLDSGEEPLERRFGSERRKTPRAGGSLDRRNTFTAYSTRFNDFLRTLPMHLGKEFPTTTLWHTPGRPLGEKMAPKTREKYDAVILNIFKRSFEMGQEENPHLKKS